MVLLYFQTREVLKGTSSSLEDELWLFNTGVELPLRCNYAASTRKSVSTLAAGTEFGSTIIPASLSGKSSSVANTFNNLLVLQDIVRMTSFCGHSDYDEGKIFFSTLSSICTISDFILRRLRGLLMVLSLDCTKLELIAEGNDKPLPNKSKGKLGACNRNKKRRLAIWRG